MSYQLPPVQTKICPRCKESIQARFDNTFHLLCQMHDDKHKREDNFAIVPAQRASSSQGFTDADVAFLKELNISL